MNPPKPITKTIAVNWDGGKFVGYMDGRTVSFHPKSAVAAAQQAVGAGYKVTETSEGKYQATPIEK